MDPTHIKFGAITDDLAKELKTGPSRWAVRVQCEEKAIVFDTRREAQEFLTTLRERLGAAFASVYDCGAAASREVVHPGTLFAIASDRKLLGDIKVQLPELHLASAPKGAPLGAYDALLELVDLEGHSKSKRNHAVTKISGEYKLAAKDVGAMYDILIGFDGIEGIEFEVPLAEFQKHRVQIDAIVKAHLADHSEGWAVSRSRRGIPKGNGCIPSLSYTDCMQWITFISDADSRKPAELGKWYHSISNASSTGVPCVLLKELVTRVLPAVPAL